MARWFVNPPSPNPFIRETHMLANPRHHKKRHHKKRHHNAPPIPWHLGRPRGRMNRRHRRNPDVGGMFSLATHPMQLLTTGAVGALATYATIVVPNAIMPNVGTDITSKALRLLTRAVWGGILHTFGSRFLPNQSGAILTGAMIGAGGGFVLDLFGVHVIVGQTDTSQTAIIPAFAMPALAGYGRHNPNLGMYTARQGAMPKYGIYTQPQLGAGFRGPVRQLVGNLPGANRYEGR